MSKYVKREKSKKHLQGSSIYWTSVRATGIYSSLGWDLAQQIYWSKGDKKRESE